MFTTCDPGAELDGQPELVAAGLKLDALPAQTRRLLTAAAALLDETRTVEDATGNPPWHYGALSLSAFRGNQATAAALISSIMRDVTQRGEGYGIACAEWANAVLSNDLGLPRDAVAAAERAAEYHGTWASFGGLWWSSSRPPRMLG